MPNVSLKEQNQWVANLFESLLQVLESLDWQQEAPGLFLVYAHDNENVPNKQADAEIARLLITWLKQVGTDIYSDRSGAGNLIVPKAAPSDTAKVRDILTSQLGLLPNNQLTSPEDKRTNIVLCGSALLGHYFSSNYYQNHYYPGLKRAYRAAQKEASLGEARSKLADYVNSQVNEEGFHHVLTELAFLRIRAKSEGASHGIVPLLLNGKSEEDFPTFIMNSTSVRIEETVWRKSSTWKGEATYENQGLHIGFFKLLKLLWVGRESDIVVLEGVYQDCLKALQGREAPQSADEFTSLIQDTIYKAKERLINSQSRTLRILSHEQWIRKVSDIVKTTLKDHLPKTEDKTERCLKEWYKNLIHGLAIQRVSGDLLPMENCYINLAVVEYQPKKVNKEEEGKLKQMFYRLRSVETVENINLKETISLEDLFRPRRLKSGVDGIPKRILIRGRAGVGKTTLAKKSLHDYLHQGLWREHFEWLLWIPLRHLKGKKKNYPLETLLYEEYFEQHHKGWDLAQALYRRIQVAPSKTLLICDGWDEVAQEKQIACLSELLNHSSVIITSRPHGISVNETKGLDLELETLGFSEANVEAYLNHPDIVPPEMAEEIKTFIKQHPFVRELVNIPIQLDALCYSWDEIRDESQSVSTMTSLYEAMVHKLWRKDMVRLDKLMESEVLTRERVQKIRQFRHLEPCIKAESNCLGALALNGLSRNQLEFKPKDLEEVIKQLEKDQHELPFELEANVGKLSCLQVGKQARSFQRVSYQFLHLTFQEFFAAQWLVDCLLGNKSLSLVESPRIRAEEFIRGHQYNPRYEIVWWFMAGLLPEEELKGFFDRLNQGPQDLIGIQHQHLMMHCLRESNAKLPEKEQVRLEAGLYTWLRFEVSRIKRGEFSSLGREEAFPENLLCKLKDEKESSIGSAVIIRTLVERAVLSGQILGYLSKLLKDEDREIRELAVKALSKQSRLSSETVASLIKLLKEGYVRESTTRALSAQSSLSTEAITSLIGLFEDENWDVRAVSAKVLRNQSHLPAAAIASLIDLFKDENWTVRAASAEVLGAQSSLSSETIARLIKLSQSADGNMREPATQTLSKQSSRSPQIMASLIELCESPDGNVRESATQALGQESRRSPQVTTSLLKLCQSSDKSVRGSVGQTLAQQWSLPPELIASLARLCQDSNASVRQSVTQKLGEQWILVPEIMECLICLCRDPDANVRKSAAQALGQQSGLSSEAVASLTTLCQDDADKCVRRLAAEALKKQWALPLETVVSLIKLCQDPEERVSQLAAKVLARYSSLAWEAVVKMSNLFEDENSDLRQAGAQTLGQQPSLSLEVMTSLLGLVKDEKKGDISYSPAYLLEEQLTLSPEAMRSLVGLFKDKDKSMRRAAARALGQESRLPVEVVMSLIELFKDKEKVVIQAAVQGLGRQTALPSEAMERLIQFCQDPNENVRELAAQALGQQSELLLEAVKSLTQLLKKDEASNVKQSAIQALGQQSSLSPEALMRLIELCQHKEEYMSVGAAQALGQQPSLPPEALEVLLELCRDEGEDNRALAAEALGQQSSLSPEVVEELIRLCSDEVEYVRRAAVKALGQQSSLSPEAMVYLTWLYQDEEWGVPETAARALGKHLHLSQESVASLTQLSQDEEVRDFSAQRLGQQSELPPEAVASLIQLWQNEDKSVRRLGAEALGKQPTWHGYQCLLTTNPSFIKELYRHWFIPSNFKQVSPLYIEDNRLCFYTSERLEMIDLNEKGTDFRQAILAAQQAADIPPVSQINTYSSSFFGANKSHDTFFYPPMPGAWPIGSDHDLSRSP